MRCSSASGACCTICDQRWISTALCWTFWCRTDETAQLPSASSRIICMGCSTCHEFASTHSTTRVTDAEVQISPPGTAIPVGARDDLRSFPAAAPSHGRSRLSTGSREGVPDLDICTGGRGGAQPALLPGSAPFSPAAAPVRCVPREGLLQGQVKATGNGTPYHRPSSIYSTNAAPPARPRHLRRRTPR
jgi:hypothetical protein